MSNYFKILQLLIIIAMILPNNDCILAQEHYAKAEKTHKREMPGILTTPIYFFRKYISNADSDRCPMNPTCSSYALETFKKHGPVLGWVMTCDRLIRCGRDELRLSPLVEKNGDLHTHDPVDQNDFWWKQE